VDKEAVEMEIGIPLLAVMQLLILVVVVVDLTNMDIMVEMEHPEL
jgi:hypothetical protein